MFKRAVISTRAVGLGAAKRRALKYQGLRTSLRSPRSSFLPTAWTSPLSNTTWTLWQTSNSSSRTIQWESQCPTLKKSKRAGISRAKIDLSRLCSCHTKTRSTHPMNSRRRLWEKPRKSTTSSSRRAASRSKVRAQRADFTVKRRKRSLRSEWIRICYLTRTTVRAQQWRKARNEGWRHLNTLNKFC